MATVTASARSSHSHSHLTPSFRKTAAPTQHGAAAADLKACLEILRKLAPKVSNDLPSLPSTSLLSSSAAAASASTSTSNGTAAVTSNSKRKSTSDREDASVKRSRSSRRSSSPECENETRRESYPRDRPTSNTSTATISKGSSSAENRRSPQANAIATTSTTSSHKRAGSTSSTTVVSLQDLKARSKQAKAVDGLDSLKKDNLNSTRNEVKQHHSQGSPLSVYTNHTGVTSISPTLPSPAPTLSSLRESTKPIPSSQHNTPALASAPSPETIALGGESANNGINGTWTREKFKILAASCREKGRALKHSGDKKMREYSSPPNPNASNSTNQATTAPAMMNGMPANRHITPILALFEQIDAVILYAYAFWCEDQAAGCARSTNSTAGAGVSAGAGAHSRTTTADSARLSASTNSDGSGSGTLGASTSSTSSAQNVPNTSGSNIVTRNDVSNMNNGYTWRAGCISENWRSIFGLVGFVRGRAEKLMLNPPSSSRVGSRIAEGLPRAMEIVVAWMNMLEALILQHLTTNASRQLNSQASRLLGTLPNISTSTASSSSTTGLSPPENLPLNDNESIISNASSSNNNGMVETNNFLQSFLKMQADLEKIHTLWPCSQNILLHPEQSALTSASLPSSSTSSNDASGRSIAVNGTSTRRDEEDLLSMVLRKGRMAYDYEPTKLDDIVIPNLPKEEGQDLFDDGEEEEEEDAEGEAEMSRDNDPDNIDPEGESVELSTTLSIPTSTGLNNSTSKRKSSNASKNSSGTSQGGRAPSPSPKSPEDLFKDEENYFRFSWPIIIHHRNSIAHTSSFGRALIFEMASRLGIDYIMPDILSKT